MTSAFSDGASDNLYSLYVTNNTTSFPSWNAASKLPKPQGVSGFTRNSRPFIPNSPASAPSERPQTAASNKSVGKSGKAGNRNSQRSPSKQPGNVSQSLADLSLTGRALTASVMTHETLPPASSYAHIAVPEDNGFTTCNASTKGRMLPHPRSQMPSAGQSWETSTQAQFRAPPSRASTSHGNYQQHPSANANANDNDGQMEVGWKLPSGCLLNNLAYHPKRYDPSLTSQARSSYAHPSRPNTVLGGVSEREERTQSSNPADYSSGYAIMNLPPRVGHYSPQVMQGESAAKYSPAASLKGSGRVFGERESASLSPPGHFASPGGGAQRTTGDISISGHVRNTPLPPVRRPASQEHMRSLAADSFGPPVSRQGEVEQRVQDAMEKTGFVRSVVKNTIPLQIEVNNEQSAADMHPTVRRMRAHRGGIM
jgi:hypothetical protein